MLDLQNLFQNYHFTLKVYFVQLFLHAKALTTCLYMQMLLAELYGLDFCFLHTLVASGGSAGVGDPPALVLQPYLENHLLQFQTVREPTTGCDMQILQAGHPKGLLAYLFTR